MKFFKQYFNILLDKLKIWIKFFNLKHLKSLSDAKFCKNPLIYLIQPTADIYRNTVDFTQVQTSFASEPIIVQW